MKNGIKTLVALAATFIGLSVSVNAQQALDTQIYAQDANNAQQVYYIPHSFTKNQIEIWHSGNQDIESRDFSLSTVTTNSSGVATVTFPATFSAVPKVIATPINNTSNTAYIISVTSKTTGSVTIQVYKLNVVLGILTLASAASGVDLDVMAFVAP